MEYTINYYRFRKLGRHYFVTTDSGSHSILTEGEFKQLRAGQISGKLKEKLLESEILLDKSNIKEFARDMKKRKEFLFAGTSLHIMVLTLRCNMKCTYCHASSVGEKKKEHDMSIETARKTVDFIFQSPSRHISIEFQGGEPLLNWDALKFVVSYAKEKNGKEKRELLFSVVTNLMLMDREKMDYLINEGINVCTSLDGPKQLHDLNRPCAGKSNFDTVCHWIKEFGSEYQKRGIKSNVGALVTLTKESLKYPKEIVDLYASLGLGMIHLRFLDRLGTAGKVWNIIGYPIEDYIKFWEKAVARIEELRKEGKQITERIADLLEQKIRTKYDQSYLDLRSPCGAAIGQLLYNYDGKIYTCDEGRMLGNDTFMLGSVSENNYREITTCPKACAVINASINDQFICDTCAYKPYCGLCPVCSLAEEGNLITNVSKSSRCKAFKSQLDWVVREKFIKQDGQ